jgi:3-phenylpropionate/trans-cinnamate dioxygenase ferredoxin reductase component
MGSEPKSIVVLGGGQAGAWAAKTLRDEGYSADLLLVSEEQHAPYERPALSKQVLSGKAEPGSTRVFSSDVLDGLRLDRRSGVRAASVDRPRKLVTLADGTQLPYDKLLFCTGGSAHRPDIRGVHQAGVFTLRTIDDCRNIASALAQARRVCVIGGGWIGLEVASTAAGMGKDVVLLERGDALCRRLLPASLGAYLLALHRAAGVEVHLETTAQSIERAPTGLRVATSADTAIEADVVVIGAGLVPNDELAVHAGLRCARGIVVDSQCVTSDPDILAAGDVAIAPNSWAGGLVRLESWQNAIEQAVAAAKNCLGATVQYDPLPWFWSEQHGINLQVYGWPQPSHRAVTRQLAAPGSFLTFLLEGERVASAVAVNAAKELRAGRKLIQQRTVVRDVDLAHPRIALASL